MVSVDLGRSNHADVHSSVNFSDKQSFHQLFNAIKSKWNVMIDRCDWLRIGQVDVRAGPRRILITKWSDQKLWFLRWWQTYIDCLFWKNLSVKKKVANTSYPLPPSLSLLLSLSPPQESDKQSLSLSLFPAVSLNLLISLQLTCGQQDPPAHVCLD